MQYAPKPFKSIYIHETMSSKVLNKDDMITSFYMFFQKSSQMTEKNIL